MNLQGRAYKLNRKLYPRIVSGVAPYVIVNEFPKSGGTWLANMLADALELPFPRHERLHLSPAIVHGHFLRPWGLRNVITLWRDPRDVCVSYYYHCYFLNEHHNAALVARMKAALPFDDYADIQTNLPAFIAFLCERPLSPSFTWMQFSRNWFGRPGVVQTSYEALRAEPEATLQKIVFDRCGKRLPDARASEIAAKHSFEKAKAAATRNSDGTAEMSFVRAGSVGGWKDFLSPDQRAHVYSYLEPFMAEHGYKQ